LFVEKDCAHGIRGHEADVTAGRAEQSATGASRGIDPRGAGSRAGVLADLAAPISAGLRELIAAYTSYRNDCEFCTKCHAAITAELLGNEESVWSVLRDPERSALPENEKALLRFVAKVTKDLPSITAAASEQLRGVGWSDDAIYYTISVCALFNFYNRWITASGVHAVSHEGHRSRAKVVAQHGYDRGASATQIANKR
jgi:uncharacterized peroxidase-related enzyme